MLVLAGKLQQDSCAAREAHHAVIAPALLTWYDRHQRSLPWRARPGEQADPYRVWLSEIMLQQTRVETVKPYFEAFLRRWPDIASLAEAPNEAVMREWAGLGYYSRARNLHACAKAIVADHGGVFPQSEKALRALPGIGRYTAAAIAAIAFGQKAAPVDGNIERIIARLDTVDVPLPAAKPLLAAKAALLVPEQRPGDFAQAMMDLGATVCTPRRPACAICALRSFCRAAAHAVPEQWPRRLPKAQRPSRCGAAFVVRRGDAVLLRTRPPHGLLGGMTEFPGTPWTQSYELSEALREVPVMAEYRLLAERVAHVFTHFSLSLDIFIADAEGEAPAGYRWVKDADLEAEALPSVMRKIVVAVRSSGWWGRGERTSSAHE
jgi:A/G-specific adenine glycosylase